MKAELLKRLEAIKATIEPADCALAEAVIELIEVLKSTLPRALAAIAKEG